VIPTEAWPMSLETTAISAPLASMSEAVQCRSPWNVNAGSSPPGPRRSC
jgi:hypothetical protein